MALSIFGEKDINKMVDMRLKMHDNGVTVFLEKCMTTVFLLNVFGLRFGEISKGANHVIHMW